MPERLARTVNYKRKGGCLCPKGEGNAPKKEVPPCLSLVSHRREVINSGKVCVTDQSRSLQGGGKGGLPLATLPLCCREVVRETGLGEQAGVNSTDVLACLANLFLVICS